MKIQTLSAAEKRAYPVAVVGGGIAGYTAALALKNLNIDYIWLGRKPFGDKLLLAEYVRNFPALVGDGKTFAARLTDQAEKEGARLHRGAHRRHLCGRSRIYAHRERRNALCPRRHPLYGRRDGGFLQRGGGFRRAGRQLLRRCATGRSTAARPSPACSPPKSLRRRRNTLQALRNGGVRLLPLQRPCLPGVQYRDRGGRADCRRGRSAREGAPCGREAIRRGRRVLSEEFDASFGARGRAQSGKRRPSWSTRRMATNLKGLFAAGRCDGGGALPVRQGGGRRARGGVLCKRVSSLARKITAYKKRPFPWRAGAFSLT